MRSRQKRFRTVTLATALCVAQGCSGEFRGATAGGLVGQPRPAGDGSPSAPGLNPGSQQGANQSASQQTNSPEGTSGPNASAETSSGYAAQPTNVAGAFLVEPQLRGCIKDWQVTPGSTENSIGQNVPEVMGLCGLEFVATPQSGLETEPPSLALGGTTADSADLFAPFRNETGSIRSILVSAFSAEEALAKVTKRMHPVGVTALSNGSTLSSSKHMALAISDRRWLIYSGIVAGPETAQTLIRWNVDLEVTPVTFRSLTDSLVRVLSGDTPLTYFLLASLSGQKIMLVEKVEPPAPDLLADRWPAHEWLRLETLQIINLGSSPTPPFEFLFDTEATTATGTGSSPAAGSGGTLSSESSTSTGITGANAQVATDTALAPSTDSGAGAASTPSSAQGSSVVADSVPRVLAGQWHGFCGHRYDNPGSCEYGYVAPMSASGACPSGFDRVHVGARLQLGDKDAWNEAWSATCVRTGAPSADQVNQPSAYALEGGVYGLCVYNSNSSSCDVASMFPMKANKTCPAGFTFTHMGARYNGLTEHWYAACIAKTSGPQMVRETGAWRGLCAYDYTGTGCSHASLGGITVRAQCPAGTRWQPFVARFNGRNEIWAGTCISLQ